jgi:hypothetical protein
MFGEPNPIDMFPNSSEYVLLLRIAEAYKNQINHLEVQLHQAYDEQERTGLTDEEWPEGAAHRAALGRELAHLQVLLVDTQTVLSWK